MAEPNDAQGQAEIQGSRDQPIDVDEFSDYVSNGDGAETNSTSVESSTLDYVYENGRRYHAYGAGQYLLPNDKQEQDRLDIMHHVFRLVLGGELCWTKLDYPMEILDVGTGMRMFSG